MPPIGLVLALGLTVGLAAQSCDVGTFTIDDLRDQVVVTNASADTVAGVSFGTSTESVMAMLAPGESRTLDTLAATKYALNVYLQDDPSGLTYRQSLLILRDNLEMLSLHPENPSANAVGAIVELAAVETALQQMQGHQTAQSCTGTITAGVTSHATVTWTTAGVSGAGIWALRCG